MYDDWSIQSKCWVVISKLKFVTDNLPLQYCKYYGNYVGAQLGQFSQNYLQHTCDPLHRPQLTGTRGYPPPMLRLRSPPVDPPPSAEVMADARNSSLPLM